MVKCKECKTKMKTGYIRLNINDKRIWTPIGFYCPKCKKSINNK